MELRRDPITQVWVLQEDGEVKEPQAGACLLCRGQESLCPRPIYQHPDGNSNWQVRVIPNLQPLLRVEGDAQRRAEGIYDKMRNLGADEIVVEHPDHHMSLSGQSDEEVAQVMRAYVLRLVDLKKDRRFQYVTVSRNQGTLAGQDYSHPYSEILATPFIPRRVRYELRACKQYYGMKERCVLCDILKQELCEQSRVVECDDQFAAFCPFASRVPYETWVLPLHHHPSFEEDLMPAGRQLSFARILRSVLRRVESVAPAYHLVIHTSPNVVAKFKGSDKWRTLPEDFHWHFEILPVIPSKPKSYSLKEVYYNSLLPEDAANTLRQAAK